MRDKQVLFGKFGPRNIPENLHADLDAARLFAPDSRPLAEQDFDLWVGSAGWRSTSHFDLQDNFYTQLVGNKSFVVASPEATQDVGLFPFTHTRHRQAIRLLLPESSETARTVVLTPGDVLFIPSFYLHTATALTPSSVSLSMCRTSNAETAAFGLETLPVPLENEWSDVLKATVLARYIGALSEVCTHPPVCLRPPTTHAPTQLIRHTHAHIQRSYWSSLALTSFTAC